MTSPSPAAETIAVPACLSCGGSVAWNAARQQLVCRSCGTDAQLAAPAGTVEHFPLRGRLADRADSGRDWQPRATHLRCRSCQSLVACDEHVVGRVCDACGTPALVPSDATGAPVLPSGVLPFRVTDADARGRLADWLKSKFVRRIAIDTVRGVYLPCWIFNARVSCRWRGERDRRTSDGESERIAIDGIVERSFDDYLISASSTVDADLIAGAGSFPTADMRAYDTRYLAGFTTEVYTRNLWDAWDAAFARMEKELTAQLEKDSKCWVSELETWPEWPERRGALVLVPAYLMTYRHGTKEYRGVVNGWTGDAAAARPRDVLFETIFFGTLFAIVAGVIYGVVWLLS